MNILCQEIYSAVVNGNSAKTIEKIKQALEENIPAEIILNEGLIRAMKEVGRLFEEGEYFVPEMLISARAMQSGMNLLRPILVEQDIKPIGKVVIGTVKGDLHDIGKNLVSMMLEGAGFQAVDLGIDVSPEKFIQAIREHHPDIVGMSALLTTTMANMRATLEMLTKEGLRNKVKVMVGGAPVTETFAQQIGADGYAPDASRAVTEAKKLLGVTS